MIFRRKAKTFDGLEKNVARAYHRCQHTSKTMGIAVVIMAFDVTLNNDETAFSCMSRRHSHESRSLHGTRVLKEDEIIWESAVKVWNDLPSQR